MLRLRILSALVLAPIALGAVYIGRPVFDLLVVAAALAMAWEWARLVGGARFDAAGAALMMAAAAAVLSVTLGWEELVVPVAVLGAVSTAAIAHGSGHVRPIWAGAGALYICLPTAAIVWLRAHGDQGMMTVFWLLAVVWATDIGAYVAGRLIGGPKLAPRISPNKTWAGLAGGVLMAGAVGSVIAGIANAADAAVPAVAGGLLAVVAQVGDLFESGVKRLFDVKDSSNLIPGHGGVLDRLDGIIAVVPAVVLLDWLGGGALPLWQ